jgi:UDP-N-acetylglucosamine 2-epimerase (non-hydrolysing)
MKIMSVVGARPQFVKLAPMDVAIRAAGHEHFVLHTGQHYAPELSDTLFDDLDIPAPDLNLDIGSGLHGEQTAQMLAGIEQAVLREKPDWVLTYGDTNSTLAAAIATVKLHVPLAHLEAGLRSGNRLMPEEHNRVVTDHLSDLLLAPTETAMAHLRDEGLGSRAIDVGDVMTDVCYRVRDLVAAVPPSMPDTWPSDHGSLLATIHRAENTDDPARLRYVIDRLDSLALPVVLVAHPRLIAKAAEFGIPLARQNVTPIPSLTYTQMSFAVSSSRGVVTDSGGLQKEAYLLERPCITVRTETEWPETLTDSWNVIDPALTTDIAAHLALPRPGRITAPFGDGFAAQRAVAAMEQWTA